MDVKEVAEVLGVSHGRVRQLAAKGALKGERVGKSDERGVWVFLRQDVEEFASRNRRPGRPHKQ